jgi:hypothetical protein
MEIPDGSKVYLSGLQEISQSPFPLLFTSVLAVLYWAEWAGWDLASCCGTAVDQMNWFSTSRDRISSREFKASHSFIIQAAAGERNFYRLLYRAGVWLQAVAVITPTHAVFLSMFTFETQLFWSAFCTLWVWKYGTL